MLHRMHNLLINSFRSLELLIYLVFNDGEVLWFESEMSPPCAHLLIACYTVYNNIIGTLWNF